MLDLWGMEKVNFLDRSITAREVIFVLAAILCLTPVVSPPIALVMGLVIAQWVGHPYIHLNHRATHILLQVSVVGLGFGMDIHSAAKAGGSGLWLTVAAIAGTLGTGVLLGRLFRLDKKTAYLVSAGTAICGGSAIAALSPVIKAEEKQVSVALGIVFILNSAALFIFPAVGHLMHLSQDQFGLWSAIAIHDTSSVVGAAGRYGSEALQVATTVKLARALWIIPVAFLSMFIFKHKGARPRIPWFIGLFVLAMVAHTYIPGIQLMSHYVVTTAHAGLTLTLFLIGSGLSKKVLVSVGVRPLVQGVILWLIIAALSLWAVVAIG
ncbi:MAG: putative sulfate exporter family transporter [Chitinophagaceae bacterium]|nr:putative sulfate exporter family transporter [Chitinophagaceae bacterium]